MASLHIPTKLFKLIFFKVQTESSFFTFPPKNRFFSYLLLFYLNKRVNKIKRYFGNGDENKKNNNII